MLVLLVLVITLGLALNVGFGVANRAGWGIDFNQFYSAAKLAGTGHLYDWDALQRVEAENGQPVPTGRLPVVIYGHKLLRLFPYPVARAVWMFLSTGALVVFALTWPRAGRMHMLVALAWSLPTAMIILFGQDTPFWLMFFAVGLLLLERRKPVSAGIAFSLCICKFHLALGIPVLLVAQRRWRTLIAGLGSVLILVGVCYLIEGPQWVSQYLKMSRTPAFSPPDEVMPTLSALTARLPWPATMEIAGAMGILLLLWTVCRERVDPGLAGAAAAACGLLVGHHALFADTALLIPLAVITLQKQNVPAWLKGCSVVMLSPGPFLLAAVWQQPLVWQVTIAPFVIAAVWTARVRNVPQ